MSVITKPIVSEKSFLLASSGKYTFCADKTCSKLQAKLAIEQIYKINVTKINCLRQSGKTKLIKGKKGKRSDIKKFIFTLKKGQKIDLFNIEENKKKSGDSDKKKKIDRTSDSKPAKSFINRIITKSKPSSLQKLGEK